MNILLISATAVDTSDIPLFMKVAFERKGHHVTLVSPQEDSTIVMRACDRSGLSRCWFWLSAFGRQVWEAARRCQPQMVLVYGSNFYVRPTLLGRLQRAFDCKIVLWEGNIQFWQWYQAGALTAYDCCFVLDTCLLALLKGPARKKNVFHLGAGCEPQEHAIVTLTDRDRERFGADVTFVGHGFPDRIRLMESLTQHNLQLWGKSWDRSDKLRNCFHDEPVYGLKKTKIYNASKIVINIQNPASQINGLSCRVFEVLACGGFPLTEYRKDVELYFRVGEEIAVFHDEKDCAEKVAYYLSHESERLAIVQRGRERVLQEHTYDKRAERMLECLASC